MRYPDRRFCLVLALIAPLAAPLDGQTASARTRQFMATARLEHQVAQLVMPWLLGNYAGFDAEGLAEARYWVDSLRVGGIIISIGSPLDVASKLNFLQRRSRQPLLIAADLESGAAYRFPGATPFPTNMGVAATGREQDAWQMGRITALEGRAVGVHLTFAPVADVNSNPANPIINTRSFGSDPARVGRLVAQAVRGTRSAGMLTTAKHFPGHGDTDTDSHIDLPAIPATWPRLDSLELVPFRAAIDAGVDVVMSAHVTLPAVLADSAMPATIAPEVLSGILRDSLGFRGLVVTDALDMGALVGRYGPGEVAVRAFEAGADMLLMPSDPGIVIAALTEAVRSGRITRARLRQSLVRVLAIKERMGLYSRRTVSLERIGRVVGQQAFLDTARSITARSLVLVRDSAGVIARLRATPGDLAVVSYGDPGWTTTLPAELTRRAHTVRRFRLYPASGPASYDSARAVLASAPTALFSVAVRATSGAGTIAMPAALAGLIDGTAALKPTALVSFGSPYLRSQAPRAWSVLLAWTTGPMTERAVASALSGAAVTGTLPIPLPTGETVGSGLQLPELTRFDATIVR